MEIKGPRTWSARVPRLLWWLAPILFLLWIDRFGLRCWFLQDDFAWLGLLRTVHRSHNLLAALFAPAAQGTIRPWSERGFFLLFESLFGFDSLPYRIWVFLTMAANVVLVAWITRRITGSRLAGFIAPVLWVANAAVSTVLDWTSAYNEALCSLFLLAALALFIRFAENGRRVWWWWQLVVFILGFGALEINVVYPALAASYALLEAGSTVRRRLLVSLLPLFAISVAYFFLHRAAAPFPADGIYAIHFDGRIFRTLSIYWQWTFAPYSFWPGGILLHRRAWIGLASAVLAAFCLREIVRRRYFVIFCGLWFLITLAPMLPIPDHRTDYYLTIPLIGISMAAAWGIDCAWRAGWIWRAPAVLAVAAFLHVMIPVSDTDGQWWLSHSNQTRAVVLGAVTAQRTHPAKTIVLDGVTTGIYEDAIAQSGFYPVGLDYVYLTPGSELNIHPSDDPQFLSHVVLDPAVMRNAITHDQVVVYSVLGNHLRNVTDTYERSALRRWSKNSDRLPHRFEAGNPLEAYLLGPEWYGLEQGVRWMPRQATVRLGGPESAQQKLVLEGRCDASQLRTGPLHLMVSVDGTSVGTQEIIEPDCQFRRLFVMPRSLVGRGQVEVAISVDRVTQEPGGRTLGLLFGAIGFE